MYLLAPLLAIRCTSDVETFEHRRNNACSNDGVYEAVQHVIVCQSYVSKQRSRAFHPQVSGSRFGVLHGASCIGQVSPRTITQCKLQQQEAVQMVHGVGGTYLYSEFTFGTKWGMESVTHLNHSRMVCPGWTPKVTSKMATLLHVSLGSVPRHLHAIRALLEAPYIT